MNDAQRSKLLRRLFKALKKDPIPILNEKGEDIPIVIIDKLVTDWLLKNMFPTAEWVRDALGAEIHRILSRDNYIIATKPWTTDLMATYVKQAGSSPDAKVSVPKWVGH